MADKDRDSLLRETAQHRGFKLIKSRRRKAGGDFGRYGLKSANSGEEGLGFGESGLTATAEEIEAFLRQQTSSTWKTSLGATPKRSPKPKPQKTEPPTPKRETPAKDEAATESKPEPGPSSRAKTPAPPKLRIREADAVDAEALARLVTPFAPANADDMARRLPILAHAGERPLVARLGDEIVGLIAWHVMPVLHRPKPVGRITYLQIEDKFQKQGIGRKLVEAVEERLRERDCGVIEVTSNVKLTKAHKFYAALGFERTSFRFAKPLESPEPRKRR